MDEGPGGEGGVDVAGGGVLHRLADGFGEDEFGLDLGPEAGAFEGFLGEAAIGGMGRVGDGHLFYFGFGEVLKGTDGARLGPEGESAKGIDLHRGGITAAGADELLDKTFIGGQKKIEGGTLLNLAGQLAGGTDGSSEGKFLILEEFLGECGECGGEVTGGGEEEVLGVDLSAIH